MDAIDLCIGNGKKDADAERIKVHIDTFDFLFFNLYDF